jgi:hypothetical protein
MRRINVDLRDRCHRERCFKLIRKGKMAQERYARYKPFCSYNCQEWDRIEVAQAYLDSRRTEPQNSRQAEE